MIVNAILGDVGYNDTQYSLQHWIIPFGHVKRVYSSSLLPYAFISTCMSNRYVKT